MDKKITIGDVEYYQIPKLNDIYYISKNGYVFVKERTITKKCGIKMRMKSRIKIPLISNTGYYAIGICENGKTIQTNIHSLLAITFIDENYLDKKLVVNHIDGNKLNNDLGNIELISKAENNAHAVATGLNPKKGESHHNSFLNERIIKEILINKNNLNGKEMAKLYGVCGSTISKILKRKACPHVQVI